MRTVTFSNPRVAGLANREFVAAWSNRGAGFHNEDYQSEERLFAHAMEAYPSRNICTFFLDADQRVFHYAAGYYAPELFCWILEAALDVRKDFREGHFRGAERFRRAPRIAVPEYRGFRHEHSDRCRASLTEGLDYLRALHLRRAREKEPPLLGEIRYSYLYGNSFTEEPREAPRIRGEQVP